MIRLSGVGHVYAAGTPWTRRALAGVDLQIGERERVVVAGPNGSGKSTLAWILGGLLAPTEGEVVTDGTALVAFQHARLQLFRPTVAADVEFGTHLDRRAVDAALRLVGLDPPSFRDRRIDELSGGEQRRVALAGLLARRPRLLVLDEPLAGLDEPSREGLTWVLAHLRETAGVTTVVVSHDMETAEALADRVVRLERGQVVADEPIGAEATR